MKYRPFRRYFCFYGGQVPHTGLDEGNTHEVAPVSKPAGNEVINVTHQWLKSWLNKVALLNIYPILVTSLVLKRFTGWLKIAHPLNIFCILVTRLVLKEFTGWLKLLQLLNIKAMIVTLEVFQEYIGDGKQSKVIMDHEIIVYC